MYKDKPKEIVIHTAKDIRENNICHVVDITPTVITPTIITPVNILSREKPKSK